MIRYPMLLHWRDGTLTLTRYSVCCVLRTHSSLCNHNSYHYGVGRYLSDVRVYYSNVLTNRCIAGYVGYTWKLCIALITKEDVFVLYVLHQSQPFVETHSHLIVPRSDVQHHNHPSFQPNSVVESENNPQMCMQV